MHGLMQDHPLTLAHFHRRASTLFADKSVVTATSAGPTPLTYGEWCQRRLKIDPVASGES
jgi:hypothetical protein